MTTPANPNPSKKQKKSKWLIISIILVLVVLLCIPPFWYLFLVLKDNHPIRNGTIDHPNGYVQASGRDIYDGEGNRIELRGTNFGNWFDQEWWMAVSTVDGFESGYYTPKRGRTAMQANPNLNPEQIEELEKLYIDEYIKEEDFQNLKALNLNTVRINFTCYNLTSDGYTLRENAFDKLDWAISMCEKYQLYLILDDHGAIGSQNQDNHSGADDTFDLYDNEKNRTATKELWKTIAERYKEKKTIACYDLLNEPRKTPGKYCGKEQFDYYAELYEEIRKIDSYHMIMMECFTFPIHGVNEQVYGFENVVYSYHIYNRTSLSLKTCLNFYKALDNHMGYQVPIVIGEFSCWDNKEDWLTAFGFFEKMGWSYLSWTYKANRYPFATEPRFLSDTVWGIYELNLEPVNLFTATYEEIKETYQKVDSSFAKTTLIYDVFKEHFVNSNSPS